MPVLVYDLIFQEINKIYLKLCEDRRSLISLDFSSFFTSNGELQQPSLTFDNLDTEPNPSLEQALLNQFESFYSTLFDSLLALRSALPPDDPPLSDRDLLLGDRGAEFEAILNSLKFLSTSPERLSEIIAETFIKLSQLLADSQSDSQLYSLQFPDLFDSQGRLEFDRNNQVQLDPTSNSEVLNKAALEINELFYDLAEAYKTFLEGRRS